VTSVEISTGTIMRVVFVLGLAFLLYLLIDLIFIILTAVVLASAVEPVTKWLGHYKISRVWAVLLVCVTSFAFIFSFLYLFIPPLFADISQLTNTLPDRIEDVTTFNNLSPFANFTGGVSPSFSLESILVQIQTALADLSAGTLTTASTIFGGAFSFVIIMVLSFYLAVQDRGIENFLRIIIPLQYESYAIDLWKRSQYKIGQWMKGQLLLGLIVGVLVYIGLSILGIPYALPLAILAALFELIPYFGPILSAIPAIALAFIDSTTAGLLTIGLYLIIQQFENHLIYPLVVKKIVGVPAIIVIISLIVGGQLAGFLGMLIAIPMATVIMEMARDAERYKLKNQTATTL